MNLRERRYVSLVDARPSHPEAKDWIHSDISQWQELGNGYHQVVKTITDRKIRQRWAMIFSQQAYERECHSFEAKIQVEENLAQKELKDLCAEKLGKK
jgi:hypothetical protein